MKVIIAAPHPLAEKLQISWRHSHLYGVNKHLQVGDPAENLGFSLIAIVKNNAEHEWVFRGFPARRLSSFRLRFMSVQDGEEFRVLVVDDEQVIADTLAMILTRSGFSVLAAYSGESALDQAQTWRPAALISDVVMPGLNGIETARGVLELVPECHVILFSGQGTLDVIHKPEEITFEVLPKPVHPEQLLRRLRAIQMDGKSRQTRQRRPLRK